MSGHHYKCTMVDVLRGAQLYAIRIVDPLDAGQGHSILVWTLDSGHGPASTPFASPVPGQPGFN